MRRITIRSIIFSLLATMACTCIAKPLKVWDYSDINMVSFFAAKGNEATMRLAADEKTSDGENVLEVSLKKFQPGIVLHSIQLRFKYEGNLKAGHTYELSFPCKATEPGKITMDVALAVPPWTILPQTVNSFETGTEWKKVSLCFTVKDDTSEPLSIPLVMFGRYGSPATIFLGPVTLWDMADKAKLVKNYIFNSSFELGDAGYGCTKFLRRDTNAKLAYEKPRIDTSTAASGTQSLRIPNPYAEASMFYSREFKLAGKETYFVSVWMKSSVDKLPVRVSIGAGQAGGWWKRSMTFKVGKKWQRFSFRVEDNNKPRDKTVNVNLWFGHSLKDPAADLWIDDLQVTADTLQPDQPGATVEACANAPKIIYLQNDIAKVKVECSVINHSDRQLTENFKLVAIDNYTHDHVAEADFSLILPPHRKQTIITPLKLKKYGTYRLEIQPRSKLADFSAHPGWCAVIGKYAPSTIQLDRDFCVGINLAGGIFPHAGANLKKGRQALGGVAPEEFIGLLAQMGCRVIRDWNTGLPAFTWSQIEPAEGQFDFFWPDTMADMCFRHNIQIIPVLRGDFRKKPKPTDYSHHWLRQKCQVIDQYLDNNHDTRLPEKRLLAPDNYWRKYVKAVGERYRGKISHYEIFNEPNLRLSPETYLPYLKSASEELRSADPSCRIIGFCTTGDLAGEGKSAAYLKPCFKMGGLTAADIVSFHPYDSRQLSSKRPADKMINTYRQLIRSFGQSSPLWNTELYYLSDGRNDNEFYKVPDAPKRFLIDLGEGVVQSMPAEGYKRLFESLVLPSVKGMFPGVESLPSSNYVIYNALARLFERSRPVDKIRWPLGCICYVYDREDGIRAAFWKYGKTEKLRLRLPFAADEVTLLDMFGNRLPSGQTIELNDSPYYLLLKKGSKLDRTKFIERLRTVKPESAKTVEFTLRRLLPTATGSLALVDVRNCTPSNLTGQVIVGISGVKNMAASSFIIPPYAVDTINLPLKSQATLGEKVLVEVRAGNKTQNELFEIPEMCNANAEYGKKIPLRRIGRSGKIKPQISGSFQVRYNANSLFFRVEVKDKTPSGKTGTRWEWQQDSVEFFIDTIPWLLTGTIDEARSYHSKVARIAILPYGIAGKQVKVMTMASGLPLLAVEHLIEKCDQTNDGYTVDLEIPWTALGIAAPLKGRCLGVEIGVNDAIGKNNAESQITWSSWGDHFRNRLSFGFIKLE